MYWQQAKRQIKPAARSISYECSGSRQHEQYRTHIRNTAEITVLFFLPFFVYFSYQRQGDIRCYQGFQRDGES